MSEEEKKPAAKEEVVEEKKAKSSKLPLIVALVLFVAGGGFFMMKSKSPEAAPKKVETLALGTIEPVKEILVNLSGGGSYLKTEIALHMVKDYKKEDLDKNMAAVSDTIILCLKAKKITDVQTADQMKALKREIANNVNAILNAEAKDKPATTDSASQKIPEGFDSATGPVLKVYFTSFATQ